MIIENLFPVPIGFFNWTEELTADQKRFLMEQPQRPNDGNTSSTDKYILKQKQIVNLTNYIEKCAHEYLMATVCPKNDVRLKLTQSWLNWTKPGQYHHRHTHPNSYVSGCFYVNANKDTDKIYFYRDSHRHISMPPIAWNIYNSENWWFPVGAGELVFFPSSLSHMVETVGGDDTRVSLAFNMFPVGHIGDENELTALHI